METKTCTKCGNIKPIDDFYKHPSTRDGHDTKCKDCVKIAMDKNFKKKILNPEFRESEKKRAREKWRRLYSDVRPTPEYKKKIMNGYKERYPEKTKAKNAVSNLLKLEGRQQRHHWSYNKEHYTDFIILQEIDHRKLHRYMIYDQERMMYRTTDGVLLDTKEKHIEYYDSLKEKP